MRHLLSLEDRRIGLSLMVYQMPAFSLSAHRAYLLSIIATLQSRSKFQLIGAHFTRHGRIIKQAIDNKYAYILRQVDVTPKVSTSFFLQTNDMTAFSTRR